MQMQRPIATETYTFQLSIMDTSLLAMICLVIWVLPLLGSFSHTLKRGMEILQIGKTSCKLEWYTSGMGTFLCSLYSTIDQHFPLP